MRRFLKCHSFLLMAVFMGLWATSLDAKKPPKTKMKDDVLYQTISNAIQPGSVVGGASYFVTAFVSATDSARVNDDLIMQVREWNSKTKVLETHSMAIPAELIRGNIGQWIRVGTGKYDDLFQFTSSSDPSLESFTIEFGFEKTAPSGDAFMIDGVQLEKALRLPSGVVASYPTPWASEKGIVSPSEAVDVNGASKYYMW